MNIMTDIIILVIIGIIFYLVVKTTKKKTYDYLHDTIEYNADVNELLKLINQRRNMLGLNSLISDKFLTRIAEDHCIYMINENAISHDNFIERRSTLFHAGAVAVGEIVGAGFVTNSKLLSAYVNSEAHRIQLDTPDYNLVGIIKMTNRNQRMYNVIIFAKVILKS